MKAKAAKESALQRYNRIKAERQANEKLFDVVSPSGMEWKLRKPKLQQFVLNGTMPLSFAAKLSEALAKAKGDEAQAFAALDWTDQARTIDFNNFIVRYCAVSPKIVENPQGGDEIGYDIEMDDYAFILKWAMEGGGEAESLDTFPEKRK